MSTSSRVWFISGCSSGIGRALATTALERGERVVATARKPAVLAELASSFGERILALKLDVTRPDQVREAVEQACVAFGRIDVLVNNAGYGLQGAVEDVPDGDARAIFETNVFGVLSLTRTVLPVMRAQGSGQIVNVSSVGGRTSAPLIGLYSATKFAIEGMSVALAGEVAALGIKVLVVEPGPYATQFATAVRSMPASPAYTELETQLSKARATLKWGDPREAARTIFAAVDTPDAPLRLAVGSDAFARVRRALRAQLDELERWELLSTQF
jgi:NAD(P)-dependent dehydrogenase (short-subunit alcohol dehydrogenase family)